MTDIALNSSMGEAPVQPASWPNLRQGFQSADADPVLRGLQMATIRNLLMAWVLTLPAAICLSASLYVLFSNLF
ncbi:hypothetical protein [Bradyrhizobium valentinum]|uniref:Uncharacterized protein n=1 Tax=Bradyrhizobium valentinum TaxID=1518501 RepID=A0A0R3KX65_9BRAD|nr:hypothetical protein [Bradyrhizobium valentinum]KRQ99389.1 hypothetical protein CQ10_25805 [Bradyrhizobium valentinum]KRR09127.1 hypothetical protein CP49_37515 [Bradyrhizobium valentinum]